MVRVDFAAHRICVEGKYIYEPRAVSWILIAVDNSMIVLKHVEKQIQYQ